MPFDVSSLAKTCMDCRLCEGAAYQMPPMLGYFHKASKILVMAQNPGHVHDDDVMNLWWVKRFDQGLQMESQTYLEIYAQGFSVSTANRKFGEIFGPDWFTNGRFSYSNAVRCMTPNNATPSEQMIRSCQNYTRQIITGGDYKLIVAVGNLALRQLMGADSGSAKWGEPTLSRTSKQILPIPHYRVWSPTDVAAYKTAFDAIASSLGV